MIRSNTSFSRLIRNTAIVSVLLVSCLSTSTAFAQRISESEGGRDSIAKFLLNFGRFIDWPATAFASDSAEFSVCVLGDNHLGSTLDTNLRGKKAGNRPFTVVPLSAGQLDKAKTCNIVYVSASESSRIGEIASALKGSSALTVSEVASFPENGGMIGLTADKGDKIAIRMHKGLIAEAGLQVREQLMRAIQ